MRKPTELMETILTSPEAQTIIDYVSPIYGESRVALWLMQVIGMALDESRRYVDELFYQVTPSTATWTIEYWEKEYGIIPDSSWTLEQRQENIVYRIRYRAPMNPHKLAQYVTAASGTPVSIQENIAKNMFRVHINSPIKDLTRIRMALEEAKPAHLIYDILVSLLFAVTCNFYTAIGVNMKLSYDVSSLPIFDVTMRSKTAISINTYTKYEVEVTQDGEHLE